MHGFPTAAPRELLKSASNNPGFKPLLKLLLLPLALMFAAGGPAHAGIAGIPASTAVQSEQSEDAALTKFLDLQTRIIGGRSADEGEWPSAVALVRVNNDSLFQRQFCGANLINSRWAVTAGHCLFDGFGSQLDASQLRVAMGFTDLANESQATEVVVANLFVHPDYDNTDPSAPHDLALIELATPTDEPFMKLFAGDARDFVGQEATVVGWGTNNFSNPDRPLFPSELNEVELPIVSPAVCNDPTSYNGIIGDGQICAGFPQGGRDSCLGDSGGPLMALQGNEFRQIGVVSFGRGCAEPGFYGVYSRVSFYKPWITDITGITDFENPEDANGETFASNTAGDAKPDSGGSASVGAILPLFMLLLALIVWRRGNEEVDNSVADSSIDD